MKRPINIPISSPSLVSKVRRRLNFDSPASARPISPYVRSARAQWQNRPMFRKPRIYRMYRSSDVPRGCEGPCKIQSFDQRDSVVHTGNVRCLSDVTRGSGLTHRTGKRLCIKSIYIKGKVWMDENEKKSNHTNTCMFWLVRDRRPFGTSPQDFGQVFNMFDNEPSTATVKNDMRDRYQVLRKFKVTVTGGPYACKESAILNKFLNLYHHVTYNHQEAAKYENHTENALLLYMACTHASNPVYASLKIRMYFYDSVTN
uniref:Capsid protein n=1 Tax=Vernonia crinkle virus TaxID=1925153 RepID=A0A1L4AB27_9GEMI|nr:coat protein [Vernonia crinkle virus]